jgi:hypothetical protein
MGKKSIWCAVRDILNQGEDGDMKPSRSSPAWNRSSRRAAGIAAKGLQRDNLFAISIMLCCCACIASSASAEAPKKSCDRTIVRDYERPIKDLPLPSPFPKDGNLSFGPRDINIYRAGFGRVVLQGNSFGYRFSAKRATDRSGRLRRPLKLHWDVETTVWRVTHSGRPLGALVRKHRPRRRCPLSPTP